jgi:Na+/proline symporter/signal transduction histidine kinase/FixJ family two-component response regulator
MFDSPFLIAVALGYVGALFAVAWIGDRMAFRRTGAGRPLIYALSISVYCTSWTFFGSVGLGATTGFDFIPVYLGPMLLFIFGTPLILRIVRLAKRQNLTSIADFLAARYGKSQAVASVVTIVLLIGSLPYIALQLKAIAVSIDTLLGDKMLMPGSLASYLPGDEAILITLTLALFAILFGTRHSDATEHQDGLMLAVALEGVVKLAAFVFVGVFVVFILFEGPADFLKRAMADPKVVEVFTTTPSGGKWLTVTFLSLVCVLLLPRQFHVAVVENNTDGEVRRARWLFPLYLLAINIFVVPIAAAGLMLLRPGAADPDFFMLTLPLGAEAKWVALAAFIGGLSAATAMVIVEAVALSIMVCNGLVLPFLLRRRLEATDPGSSDGDSDLTGLVLLLRRAAIIVILMLAYGVYAALAHTQSLGAIGLISFAAIAQVAPAFLGGLMWREATARGAIAGMLAGMAVWTYTLLLPWVARAGYLPIGFVRDGPLDIAFLRPEALMFLQFDPLAHAVFWSMTANIATFVIVSVLRPPLPIERLQARIFVPEPTAVERSSGRGGGKRWRTSVTIGDLEQAAARYLGTERAARSFAAFTARKPTTFGLIQGRNAEADVHAIRFTENLLTSAVGAASARLVLSLLLRKGNVSEGTALRLLDDASEALQFNRDLLQSALDQVRHGLAVFDKDMRLMCWNRPFRELMNLPDEVVQLGAPLDTLLRVSAGRAGLESPVLDEVIGDRVLKLAVHQEIFHERELSPSRILEVRTSPMPQGGIVVTFSDITHRVLSDAALARANETLERRVHERTLELMGANTELADAKLRAEAASLDKTRFIAAASHDILQPLNAARLYTASLVERELPPSEKHLIDKLDSSLVAVEEIFSALIEVSRIDAGRLEPEYEAVPLAPMFDQLRVEFEPMAQAKGLALRFARTKLWVRSDRRMLRRVLQNLIANAIKYTPAGRVVVGPRLRAGKVAIAVYDTGPGIAPEHQVVIFQEFRRLDGSMTTGERGVGLGLSIVDRICRLLQARIELRSTLGKGSMFAVHLTATAPVPEVASATVALLAKPGSLIGVKVLCLDNEPEVLAGMEALLREWGSSIETAGSAAQCTGRRDGDARSRSDWPQIILADYHLDNGLTGLDAIAEIRRAAGMEIPAVIITADHSTEIQREIREAGFVQLKKPVKPAALRAVIAQTLMRQAQSRGAERSTQSASATELGEAAAE